MANQATDLVLRQERLDETPLLLAQLRKMQVPQLLDECFTTHGNWQGLSLGNLITIWLAFILAEGNHRLSHLREWVAARSFSLQAALDVTFVETDFTDDRLAQALDYLYDEAAWTLFEEKLNARLLRVYDLATGTIRLDSTSAKSFGTVTPEGLLQFGHSKDHRPDLPQFKIQLSTLDPLGLPLTATITSGEKADDPLYVPEIDRVRQTLGKRGLLYVGDCKMAALATRIHLAAGGDWYLCPFSSVQMPAATLSELLAPVRSGAQAVQPIWRTNEETGRREKIAEGFEYETTLTGEAEGQPVVFTERRMVVRGLAQAKAQKAGLRTRLKTARAAIRRLGERKKGKPSPRTEAEWRAAVDKILKQQRVVGLLGVDYDVTRQTRQVRGYGTRPATERVEETVKIKVTVDMAAQAEAEFLLGWRVYVTNAPAEQLSLTQAVLAYRGSFLIERGFRRLKGRQLSLTPLYLQKASRLTGLVRLLLIGLRTLGLVEYQARRTLAEQQETLAGLTKGLPQKATARPTAEALLRAFEGITLFSLGQQWYLTPLTALQQRILKLLGFSEDIYHRILPAISDTQFKMGET